MQQYVAWFAGIYSLFLEEYLEVRNIPDCANNTCLYLSYNHS